MQKLDARKELHQYRCTLSIRPHRARPVSKREVRDLRREDRRGQLRLSLTNTYHEWPDKRRCDGERASTWPYSRAARTPRNWEGQTQTAMKRVLSRNPAAPALAEMVGMRRRPETRPSPWKNRFAIRRQIPQAFLHRSVRPAAPPASLLTSIIRGAVSDLESKIPYARSRDRKRSRIFISDVSNNIDAARVVQAALRNAGYYAWLDDSTSTSVSCCGRSRRSHFG